MKIWLKQIFPLILHSLSENRHIRIEGYPSCVEQGEMAEWSIATVLKTVVRRRTGGSNPSLSATQFSSSR